MLGIAMPIEEDVRWFDANRGELLKTYAGKFVIIKDGAVRGSYDSAQAAYEAGVRIFALERFLVKQVLTADPVEHMPAVWIGTLRAAV